MPEVPILSALPGFLIPDRAMLYQPVPMSSCPKICPEKTDGVRRCSLAGARSMPMPDQPFPPGLADAFDHAVANLKDWTAGGEATKIEAYGLETYSIGAIADFVAACANAGDAPENIYVAVRNLAEDFRAGPEALGGIPATVRTITPMRVWRTASAACMTPRLPTTGAKPASSAEPKRRRSKKGAGARSACRAPRLPPGTEICAGRAALTSPLPPVKAGPGCL